ncbi:hypothetical protein DXG01_012380, partial [Tephrocybe rancida]
MPPADNDPTETPDGKKPSLGKRFLVRVKGLKPTKSSSASSTPATQSTEIRAAHSAADEKSLSKTLLAPFKESQFTKSSFAPSTSAAQPVDNLSPPGASAAQLVVNTGIVTAAAAAEAAATAHVLNAADTTLAMNVDEGSPASPAAAVSTSTTSVDQRDSVTPAGYTAAAPTLAIKANQRNSSTAVPSLVVSQNLPALKSAYSTNIHKSTAPGPNVPQDQSSFKGEAALDLTIHVLTVDSPTEGVNVALDGCLTALRIAKEASDWNPVLKAALGGITVSDNSQEMKDTLARIQGLLPILETSAKRLEGRKDGFGKGNNLLAFAITMQTELDKIQQMQSHGLFRRVLQGTQYAATLLGVYKNISEALEQFK